MRAEKRSGRRKRGLLACFEAPAVADGSVEEEGACSSSGSLPDLPAVLSTSSSSSSSSSASSLRGEEEAVRRGDGRTRRRFPRRALARILRSALFVSSLQKVRKGKSSPDSKQPPPSLETTSPTPPWVEDDPASFAGFSSSSLSSSSSATSSSSSTVTRPPPLPRSPEPTHPKKAPTPPSPPRGDGASAMGPFLFVLLVLFVVIFWGRLCAIIWTSMCLSVVLGRQSESHLQAASREGWRQSPPGATSRKRWSEDSEKRRVVLEGLLDRRRRP